MLCKMLTLGERGKDIQKLYLYKFTVNLKLFQNAIFLLKNKPCIKTLEERIHLVKRSLHRNKNMLE